MNIQKLIARLAMFEMQARAVIPKGWEVHKDLTPDMSQVALALLVHNYDHEFDDHDYTCWFELVHSRTISVTQFIDRVTDGAKHVVMQLSVQELLETLSAVQRKAQDACNAAHGWSVPCPLYHDFGDLVSDVLGVDPNTGNWLGTTEPNKEHAISVRDFMLDVITTNLTRHQKKVLAVLYSLQDRHAFSWWCCIALGHALGDQKTPIADRTMQRLQRLGLVTTEFCYLATCGEECPLAATRAFWGLTTLGEDIARGIPVRFTAEHRTEFDKMAIADLWAREFLIGLPVHKMTPFTRHR